MNNQDTITLYPSNWLYNASVIGFLRVNSSFDDVLKDKIEAEWIKDDGTVVIPIKIFAKKKDSEPIVWLNYQEYHRKHYNKEPQLWSNKAYFSNYLPVGKGDVKKKGIEKFKKVITYLSDMLEYNKGKSCSICNGNLQFNSEVFKNNDLKEFITARQKFNMMYSSIIAPSLKDVPNSFWNTRSNDYLCPLCLYLLIHHIVSFSKTKQGEIFINAPSFKMMWNLNKYMETAFGYSNVKDVYATSLMNLSQKINRSISVWNSFNMEVIIKKYDIDKGKSIIDTFTLPYETSKLFLNRNISNLITSLQEPFILETIFSGKYFDLINLNHAVLRASFTKEKIDKKNNSYLSRLKNVRKDRLKNLCKILPELYIRITKSLNSEV